MEKTKSTLFTTQKLVQASILIAIIIVMTFTPLGYFKTAGVEITFLTIPVVIGAILLGPVYGAILGGVFGITSFIQCFGLSAFGGALLNINPFYTFIVCLIPRILLGFLSGAIFKALNRIDKTKLASFAIASASGAIINTSVFVGLLMLLFGRTEFITDMQGAKSIFAFMVAFVGMNGLIEAIVCCVVGAAISKTIMKFRK